VRADWPTLLLALSLTSGAGCARPSERPVRIVLSLHGAAGRPVHGFDVTVALPGGTTVAHDRSTRRISPGALTLLPAAGAATADGRFVPHATAPSIRVLLASKEPLRDGEVVALLATVTSVAEPSRARFEVASSAISGPEGASVSGATGWVSAVDPR
jgi:hypothetical protein